MLQRPAVAERQQPAGADDVADAGGHRRHLAAGGRHRHHEYHARHRHRAHPGDRHPPRHRRRAPVHRGAVPHRGGHDLRHRRHHRHRRRLCGHGGGQPHYRADGERSARTVVCCSACSRRSRLPSCSPWRRCARNKERSNDECKTYSILRPGPGPGGFAAAGPGFRPCGGVLFGHRRRRDGGKCGGAAHAGRGGRRRKRRFPARRHADPGPVLQNGGGHAGQRGGCGTVQHAI